MMFDASSMLSDPAQREPTRQRWARACVWYWARSGQAAAILESGRRFVKWPRPAYNRRGQLTDRGMAGTARYDRESAARSRRLACRHVALRFSHRPAVRRRACSCNETIRHGTLHRSTARATAAPGRVRLGQSGQLCADDAAAARSEGEVPRRDAGLLRRRDDPRAGGRVSLHRCALLALRRARRLPGRPARLRGRAARSRRRLRPGDQLRRVQRAQPGGCGSGRAALPGRRIAATGFPAQAAAGRRHPRPHPAR